MKKIILSLVLVTSLVCTAIVPASAVFVSSTTLSTEIKSEVEMKNTFGVKVEVETYTSSSQEAFSTTKKPAIIVTSAASVKAENEAEAETKGNNSKNNGSSANNANNGKGKNEAAAEPVTVFEKIVEAVTAAETIEELVEMLDLNSVLRAPEQSTSWIGAAPSAAAAENPIVISDYAVVDVAYVEVNEAMQEVLDENKDIFGQIAEPPVVTVEVAGITAASEVVVVFVPDDPTAPSQVVESTVNRDGTLSFEYITNGTYLFLIKLQ